MRQFDVIITPSQPKEPPFEDRDLGWFYCESINGALEHSEAEWIVFATPEININREFLNSLAECISGFPMVDAFAPRLRTPEGNFFNGLRLEKNNGFAEIVKDDELRYIAAPHPMLAAFSRRIVQRTGKLDQCLPETLRLADFCLRMLHAGGKMFHVPYLVAETNTEITSAESLVCNKVNTKSMALLLNKTLGFSNVGKFALHHPSVIPTLLHSDKEFKLKQKKATDLSKLKSCVLEDISKP